FDLAVALANVTAPTFDIEREGCRLEPRGLCCGKVCVYSADLIPSFYICDGVGPGRPADRILINHLDLFHPRNIAFKSIKYAGLFAGVMSDSLLQGGIENPLDQGCFARPRHARNDGKHI